MDASKRKRRGRKHRPTPVARPPATPLQPRERSAAAVFAEAEPWAPRVKGVDPGQVPASRARRRGVLRGIAAWFNRFAFRYPARLTMAIFLALILLTTVALLIPGASVPTASISVIDAFFTAVSAVCVTGLTVVDTAATWTFLGQLIIAAGITLGGLGVMVMASMLALVVSRRLGLTQKLMSANDTRGRLSDTGTLVMGVLVTTAVVEVALFLILLPQFMATDHSVGNPVWAAAFTSISMFNNAGFVNLPDGVHPFLGSWGILLPMMTAAFIGAIGFPVITDLRRHWRSPSRLSLHTKLTLSTYIGLAATSGIVVAMLEWNNPGTFGPLTLPEKLLNSVVEAINPRSLGVSALDVGSMTTASWLVTDASMFIGGGSGSHAGGIKVTTFAVLLLAAAAEATGRRDVGAFKRRIPIEVIRQAVAVLLAGSVLVLTVAGVLLVLTPFSLDKVLFEVVSAFGTVGLSTGITPFLNTGAKAVLGFLMIAGRVGPMTLAASLALRHERSVIRHPEERPIVG